jgi:uncharacterized membrane protein
MTKKQYLSALEKELLLNGVADVDDVLADYEAHFARKALDGYTEEEIAHKLGNPQEIAVDFLPEVKGREKSGTVKGRGWVRLALAFTDLAVLPFFGVLFLWAIAMLCASIGVLALGVYVALGMDALSFVPVIPVAGGILLGTGIAVFSVLLLAGSLWFLLLARQMMRAYLHWHGNRWLARHELALPVMPQITGKRRRVIRFVVVFALIGFIMLFVAAYILLSMQAGTLGFWHYWHWFEAVQAEV